MGAGIHGHGPTAREQAILDRTDAGAKVVDVADELGLSPAYVHQVASNLSGSWAGNNAFDAMVAAGSRLLAKACARVGRFQ